MNINEDTVKGKWLEIKGDVQKAWGKLTSDEIEKTKGDTKAIAGLVQQKYGEDKDAFQKKYYDIVNKYSAVKDATVEKVKDGLKQ